MRKQFTYNKLVIATVLLLAMNVSYAAFTGKSDDHKNKFSLKNLGLLNKLYSLSSLRTNTFQYKGSFEINQQSNGSKIQSESMIRMERGNTTYVYPYKYTVKVPKFKTPSAPLIR